MCASIRFSFHLVNIEGCLETNTPIVSEHTKWPSVAIYAIESDFWTTPTPKMAVTEIWVCRDMGSNVIFWTIRTPKMVIGGHFACVRVFVRHVSFPDDNLKICASLFIPFGSYRRVDWTSIASSHIRPSKIISVSHFDEKASLFVSGH